MTARLTRTPDGGFEFEELDAWLVVALQEIPRLLEPHRSTRVDARLFPVPGDDEEDCEEWRRLVHPELFHLLASHRQVVEKDLQRLEQHAAPQSGWRLAVPAAHVQAWLSALNAARLALFELHGLDGSDMADTRYSPGDPTAAARARIHLFGWIQELVVDSLRREFGD